MGHPFAVAGIEFRSVLLLPLAHAVAGCDTMSRSFAIGKGVPLRKFCSVYGAQTGEGLDALPYRRFYEKVSKSSTIVQLYFLPPTSAAASCHSALVYVRVQQWMGKETIWTQNNGAGYECGIALSQY